MKNKRINRPTKFEADEEARRLRLLVENALNSSTSTEELITCWYNSGWEFCYRNGKPAFSCSYRTISLRRLGIGDKFRLKLGDWGTAPYQLYEEQVRFHEKAVVDNVVRFAELMRKYARG